MKYYYFLDQDQSIIRIMTKRRPTEKTIPKRGTWVLNEHHSDLKETWIMPPFPEITWPTLKRMQYIGSTNIPNDPPSS